MAAEAAVLFVDVSGSTRLYETAGDAVAHSVIDKCLDLFRSRTESFGGRVVKGTGDGVMSVFPDAGPAGDAAVEMQLAIAQMPPVRDSRLGVRIGFHFGPLVESDDGDVYGDTVNIAARLCELATKDQVLTSRETVERMSPAQRRLSRRLYSMQVKGKAQEVELYEILWQESEEQTTLASRSIVRPRAERLRVKYLENERVYDAASGPITLGRDREASIVIVDRMASRAHGKIECRLGKFVLADHSANGTYVTFGDESEIMLRREELVLRGHGFIAFGQPRATANGVVEFSCE